jgi:glycosyltransferase involved in cell wall biosynthesis
MHALQQLAARLGVLQRVVFHGYLSHPEVLGLFARSDAFVLPTLSESCSMAMIEAMAAGLPIVATTVGGNPALVRHEENGLLVPPGTVLALANAMRALIADPGQRRRMGERNVELANNQLTAIANARHYVTLYRRALAGRRSRA